MEKKKVLGVITGLILLQGCEDPTDTLLAIAAVGVVAAVSAQESCTPGHWVVFPGGGTGWAVGNC